MTEAIEENARLLEMSKTDYYRLKNGQVIEGPTYPTSAKVLSLEELRALAPDTAITAKYYSARRGGVARHKLTVGRIILPKAEGTPIELYRTTRGFAEDVALRADLETKQGYEFYSSFDTPKDAQEAASRLAGQDLKFVKHISTTNVPTWEIYAKPVTPKAPVTEVTGKETFVFRGLNFREIKGGIGLQVQVPETQKWVDTAILNRRTLASDYNGVPDLALWKGRVLQGTLNFPSEIAISKAESGMPFYWHSISELKQMCRRSGLSTEGSKEDLIRRLRRL